MRRAAGSRGPRWLAFGVCLLLVCIPACLSKRHNTQPPGSVHMVRIPPGKGIEIRVVLALQGKRESFSEVVERARPYAAINGTFYTAEMIPLGDVLIDGKVMRRGGYPNAVAMRKDGCVEFIRRKGKRFDWTGYSAALAAGPRLIHEGRIALDPMADGFRKRALTIVAPRSGVGLSKSGELLMVVQTKPVTLAEFSRTMLDLGAVEAMNLDGGPACGLYYDGKIQVHAMLPMTNVLCVFKRD